MDNNKMFELAEQLKSLRDEKDDMERMLKDINGDIDDAEYKLSELMAESETQSFTRSGTMFYLTTKTRASAVSGTKDDLFAALKAHGYGSLVTETVNANSLSSFVKEQISEYADTNGGETRIPKWLDGLVNVFDKTTVALRKAK